MGWKRTDEHVIPWVERIRHQKMNGKVRVQEGRFQGDVIYFPS